MDRDQLIEYLTDRLAGMNAETIAKAIEDGRPSTYRDALRPLVENLTDALLLDGVVEHRARKAYRVKINDPDMTRAYEFERIEAPTAAAAHMEGARRAIRLDPRAGMPGPEVPESDRHFYAENHSLVEAVAMYGTSEELVEVARA